MAWRSWGPIAGGEVTAIPGAAEQRGELAGALAEHVENGGKLLGEEEEAAIGGRGLIAQGVDDGIGVGRAVVIRPATQRGSTSVKRLAI